MTFIESIKVCILEKPFTYAGRASRSEFWWFYLFTTLVNIVLSQTGTLGIMVNLLLILPMIFVSSRRLHDSNLSGWFQVLPIGIVITSLLLFQDLSPNLLPFIFLLAASLSVYLYCRKGTPGPNRFGNNPLRKAGKKLHSSEE